MRCSSFGCLVSVCIPPAVGAEILINEDILLTLTLSYNSCSTLDAVFHLEGHELPAIPHCLFTTFVHAPSASTGITSSVSTLRILKYTLFKTFGLVLKPVFICNSMMNF